MSVQTQPQAQPQNQSQTQTVSVPANVPPPYVQPPTPPAQAPVAITPEQQEFLNVINDLIAGAQELSYEMATLDPEIVHKVPEIRDLLEAGKRVVGAVKRLHKLIRVRTTR